MFLVDWVFNVLASLGLYHKKGKILFLGLDNAGKTTVVKKFNGEDIDTISPTLGFNIQTLEYRSYKLNIWDVGGQTSLRSYWRNYFEQTDGIIWVVDSADRARLRFAPALVFHHDARRHGVRATVLVFKPIHGLGFKGTIIQGVGKPIKIVV